MGGARRRSTRLGRAARTILVAAVLLTLGAWTVGRIASDRWLWSQFLSWIPTAIAVGLALGLTGLASRIGRGSRRGLVGAAWIATACVAAYMGAVEWRLVSSPRPRDGARPGIDVMAWNASEAGARTAGAALERPWDVLVLANADRSRSLGEILEGRPGVEARRAGRIAVVSALPILSWGATSLGLERDSVSTIEGAPDLPRVHGRSDPGEAVYVVVDATAIVGRPITIWAIDMPSNPFMSRWRAAGRARVAIEAARTRDGSFPDPDLFIGDFNIPGGSASLRVLAPGMSGAFGRSGRGIAGSWPRRLPLLHLDQALVGGGADVTGYRLVDPGAGMHRAQVVRVHVGDR